MMKSAIFYWLISMVVLVCGRQLSNTQMEQIDDDLHLYLRSLHRVADFFLARKNYVDVIVNFALFLENMNLKRVLKDKGSRLPIAVRAELGRLVRKNNELIKYFNRMLEQDSIPDDQVYKNLTSLFNERVWLNHLGHFHDIVVKKEPFLRYGQKYLRSRYTNWHKYLKDINARGTPSTQESDACLLSVALNPINYSDEKRECDVHEDCRQFMHRGTDLGYSLTHRYDGALHTCNEYRNRSLSERLLMLFVANNARGCYVISPEDDRRLRNKFCGDMYTESEFIESNGYRAFDLFAEQIFFCSLDGHSEFIKRHWLVELLNQQTDEGCFPDEKDNREALKLGAKRKRLKHRQKGWLVNNVFRDKIGRFLLLDGRCNGHSTVLVAGVLSSAVRFLLEKFY